MKIVLLNRNDDGNYSKNYASTIYRSLFYSHSMHFRFGPLSRAFLNRRVFDENAYRICVDRKPKRLEMYPCF